MPDLRVLWILAALLGGDGAATSGESEPAIKNVAGVVTVYRRNAHADVILGRILQTDTLDGRGRQPRLKLVSLYVDQVGPNDLAHELSERHGFRLCQTIPEALTLGTGRLAVDGVLVIAEHGEYPRSETGQTIYPKRRFVDAIASVFAETGGGVPVFSDKHLADNSPDAVHFYDTLRRLQVPLMAGSSIATTWRDPPIDVRRGEAVQELVVLSYGPLDAYGFHALDLLQALAERRNGGETGVRRVRCLTGTAVWDAGRDGDFDLRLMESALSRLKVRRVPKGRSVMDLAREPVAYLVEYQDGLKGTVLTLNGAVAEWAVAWRSGDEDAPRSFVVDLQNERPFMHFAHLLQGVEQMMHTGQPAWPVERTLFSSVILDAALSSKRQNGTPVDTPALRREYTSDWTWRKPDDAGR